MTLIEELRSVLNRRSAENRSNTPDWILAEYMMDSLRAFEKATLTREAWYNASYGCLKSLPEGGEKP